MTTEEKHLLLKALCEMLPYGVKCTTKSTSWNGVYDVEGYRNNHVYLDCPVYDEDDDEWSITQITPYLRPMSSMTEEEKNTYDMFFNEDGLLDTSVDVYVDWLNAHHFDYRGLIEKGLALPAKDGMYDN